MAEKDRGKTAKEMAARKKPAGKKTAKVARAAVKKPSTTKSAERSAGEKSAAAAEAAGKKSASKRRPAAKASTRKKAEAKKSTERPADKVSAKKSPAERTATESRLATAQKTVNIDFVPNIVAFACNWCSYAGADNAGVNRVQYSPNFRVIRTMCSGRVTPAFVLKAFKLGADGVLVSGCHFGDCHYIFGNYRAVEQFEKTKALVRTLGLDERRVRLEWVSAAEGTRWGEVIDEFVAQITELGPSPLNHRKKAK